MSKLTFSGSKTTSEIPEKVNEIRRRITQLTGEEYDQITANYYQPGEGIPPHVDNPCTFGESIVSLSLMSPVEFEFRRDDNVYSGSDFRLKLGTFFTGRLDSICSL